MSNKQTLNQICQLPHAVTVVKLLPPTAADVSIRFTLSCSQTQHCWINCYYYQTCCHCYLS